MSKYCGSLKVADVAELEIKEATCIMSKYNASKKDIECVKHIIKQAYHELEESYRHMQYLTDKLHGVGFTDEDIFKYIISREMKRAIEEMQNEGE